MKQTKSRTIKDSFTTKINFKSFLVTAGKAVAYQLNALFVENILAAKWVRRRKFVLSSVRG